MASTNIGRNNEDASFRYKMPRMTTKIEGRGNGIKTVILNMNDISKALNCFPDYPTKYFGIELGAQSKFDKKLDRAIVNGSHDVIKLTDMLNKFIDVFILCPNCKLPEIVWQVDEKKEIVKVDCAACGNHSTLNPQHKLVSYIVKNPPSSLKKGAKKEEKGKKDKKGADKDDAESDEESQEPDSGHHAQIAATESLTALNAKLMKATVKEDEEVVWDTDTSKEAIQQRREAEKRAMGVVEEKSKAVVQVSGDGVSILKSFIAESEKSNSQILAELRRISLARKQNDTQKYKTLLDSLFDTTKVKTVPEQLKARIPLLTTAAPDLVTRAVLFVAIEEFLTSGDKLLPIVTPFLHTLYEADLYSEEFLVCWFESPPETSLTIPKPAAVELRNRAKVFIEWLKNAEDDVDEEESEEDD